MNFNVAALMSPTKRPLIATFVGDGGMGKTTLGSLFPDPVFILVEDGTQAIAHRQDVALFPVAKKVADVKEAIQSLRVEPHQFKTVVIDSITQLDVLIQAEIVAADGKAKSINAAGGGYGAGWNMVSAAHREIRDLIGALADEREMNVVFLAHAQNEMVDSPESESYMRATMRLNSKSVGHYSDNVDLVGFLKLKTYVAGEGEKKRAIGDGSRIITCYPTPSHISKNRFGITTDLPFDGITNPFKPFLGGNNMAALNAFDATKVAPAVSISDCVPAGEYVAMITESSMAVTKSGGEMLKLTVTILEGQHQNRKVWANLNLINANPTAVEIAQRELSAICHAVGVLNLNDSAQLHNKPLVIKTAVKTDPQYADRAEVKAWKAVSPLSKPTPAVSPAPSSGSASSAPAWKPATQASQPSQPVGGAVKPHESDPIPF